MRTLNLQCLLRYAPEIHHIATEVLAFKSAVKNLTSFVDQIREDWIKGALNVLNTTIQAPLDKLIVDFAERSYATAAWNDLQDIFCGARISGSMLQFLATHLGENGAKEALRSFRAHAEDAEDAILSALPLAENVLFRTSQYRGMDKLDSRFSHVGVEFSDAHALFEAAQALYLELGVLACEIEEMAAEGKAFLTWLVSAAASTGGDAGQGRSSTTISNHDETLVFNFFGRMTISDEDMMDTGRDKAAFHLKTKVDPALDSFCKAVDQVIDRPSLVISSRLSINAELSFSLSMSNQALAKGCSMYENLGNGSEGSHFCVSLVDDNGHLLCVRYDFTEAKWDMLHTDMLDNGRFICDAALFPNDRFMLVTSAVNDEETEGGKVSCDLLLYEMSTMNMWQEVHPVRSSVEDVTVSVPDSVCFAGNILGSVKGGPIQKGCGISLAANLDLRLVRYGTFTFMDLYSPDGQYFNSISNSSLLSLFCFHFLFSIILFLSIYQHPAESPSISTL